MPIKTSSDKQKTGLEVALLRRQLSWQGTLLEWLKAATVPAALLSVMVTFAIGLAQLKQSEEARTADRFEKALARISSEKQRERMSGVSALSLFLSDPHQDRQIAAMRFLTDSLALETDPVVQTAILDTFSHQKRDSLDKKALDLTLETVVERNRSLTRSMLEQSKINLENARKKKVAEALRLDGSKISSPISQEYLDRLNFNSYLELLMIPTWPFRQIDKVDLARLDNLRKEIEILVGLGAVGRQFSGIYCEGCSFVAAKNLQGARFDNAFLDSADFSGTDLSDASFVGADIGRAKFFSANLSRSIFRESFRREGSKGSGLPLFECANLSGANLSGLTLLHLDISLENDPKPSVRLNWTAPQLRKATFDEATQLSKLGVLTVKSYSDDYLAKASADAREKVEKELRGTLDAVSGLTPNAVVNDMWTTVFDYFSEIDQPEAFQHGRLMTRTGRVGYLQSADLGASDKQVKSWLKESLQQILVESGLDRIGVAKALASALPRPSVRSEAASPIPGNQAASNEADCGTIPPYYRLTKSVSSQLSSVGDLDKR